MLRYNNARLKHTNKNMKGGCESLQTNIINESAEIGSYSELIDTYGPITVILAVFIVVLLIAFSVIIKNMHNSNKQIMEQQKQLLDQILKNEQNTSRTQPVKEKNIVEMFIKIDDSIRSILKDIKDDIHSDRISVYVFHNGIYSSHGLPFFKTSCVSEVFGKNCGISKKVIEHSGLSLSLFHNSISHLYQHGSVIIPKVEDIKNIYPVIYSILERENIKSGAGVAIYDSDNNILGILIAEFVEDKSDQIENITKKLIKYTSSLSPILEYSDFQHFSDASNSGQG